MKRGQWLIVGIFGVSLAAALFSLGYRYLQTRDVLAFWETEAAGLIASPSRVEAWKLAPIDCDAPEDGEPRIALSGACYRPVATADVTKARGFKNARFALTVDRSFEWEPARGTCEPTWSHALVFSDGDRRTVVLLSLDCPRIRRADGDRVAGLRPTVVQGFRTLLEGQFSPEAKSGTTGPKDHRP